MNFLKKRYQKLAYRFYSVGKQQYEKHHEQMMFARGEVAGNTRFYPGSDIINLSGRKEMVTIGENCHISGLLFVHSHGGAIIIGDNCSLSERSRIASAQKIQIGNRVLIAHNVNIIDNISHSTDAQLRHEDFISSFSSGTAEYDVKGEEILIEDDVWIGFNSTILRGVKIGRGAIIGAGTTVTKDIRPWTVNVGNPIRCVRELTPVEVNNIKV